MRCWAPVDARQNGTSVAIKVRLEVVMVVDFVGERLAEERRLWAISRDWLEVNLTQRRDCL